VTVLDQDVTHAQEQDITISLIYSLFVQMMAMLQLHKSVFTHL